MTLCSRIQWYATVAATSCFALSTIGCNLYGRLDNPGELQDKYAAGVALANAGDCVGARDLLKSITLPNDDALIALGWAQLCVGGATASVIASSLYQFSNGSSDYTAIGVLARNLLPMTTAKTQALGEAEDTFSRISDGRRRQLESAIAQLARAAAVLAGQAANDGASALVRDDISAAACANDAASCATTTNCTTGMSADAVSDFIGEIDSAATNLALTGANDLSALAQAVKSGVAAGTNPARCFIFNQVVPSP